MTIMPLLLKPTKSIPTQDSKFPSTIVESTKLKCFNFCSSLMNCRFRMLPQLDKMRVSNSVK